MMVQLELSLHAQMRMISKCDKFTLEGFLTKNKDLPADLCEAIMLQMHSSSLA